MSAKPLLRQNSELRRDRIWNFSLPAWVHHFPDGRSVNVCPEAGACVKLCYARNGTYRFPNVLAAHQRNLLLAMDTPDLFLREMLTELDHKRFKPTGVRREVAGLDSTDHLHPWVRTLLEIGAAVVRIHDSGDFFSEAYIAVWMEIARQRPDILFYAYTKSVTMFRKASLPSNLLICYSLGGKQDHLLDLERDRHADVFPTKEALEEAGYFDQEANDLLCVLAPSHKVGIVSNNIPHFRKRQGDRTFGQIELEQVRHSRR